MPGEKTMTMDDLAQVNPIDMGEAESNAAAEAARKEIDIEAGNKPSKEETPPEKSEEDKAKEAEATEKEAKKEEAKKAKEAKEAEEKLAEDTRILEAKDEDLKDEEKPRKAELIKAKEEAEVKADEEATKGFAERKKMPIEEAKKEREHIKAIIKKYENKEDLADAYLNIQRGFTKSQDDLKAEKEAAPVKKIASMSDAEIITKYVESGKYKYKGKPVNREDGIALYREMKPAQAAEATDEAVLAMIADTIRQQAILKEKEYTVNSKVAARDKREAVMTTLSEEDKKYSDEIREVLSVMPDNNILAENLSLGDIILWAKGKKVDEVEKNYKSKVKESYDEGYKKGKEEAKILGVKAGETKPSGQPPKKTPTLNEAEKQEALDMFDVESMTEEDKFKAYAEVIEDRKKVTKKES